MPKHLLSIFHAGGTMGALMRRFDWSQTSLGVPESWPAALRTLIGVMLAAKQPMYVAWGPAWLMLYNDAYIPLLGSKHPAALARPFMAVWGEAAADLAPLIEQVAAGEPVHMDDITLTVDRRGRPEEAHFAFSYTPVRDDGGAVTGLFCPCTETTEQVLEERRQTFRLALEERLRDLDDPHDILAAAVQALGQHLGASRVGYGQVQPDKATVRLEASYVEGVEPLPSSFPLGDVSLRAVARQRKERTSVCHDTQADPAHDASRWDAVDTRAYVSVPLVREKRLKAVLYVNQREPRVWSRDEIGLVEDVATRVWDAVERAQAEAALRASEAHLGGLFKQTGAGFAELDFDGRFQSVNDHFCDLVGRNREDLLRLRLQDITHAEDIESSSALLDQVASIGEPLTVEKRFLRSDGSVTWVANTVSLIDSARNRPTLLAVVIDVTERKRAEREMAAAKDAAIEANLAKSTFIANMSHELRTPLSAIIGYCEMLIEEIEDSNDPAGLAPDMRKIEGNARHLLGLINDVLDLSKIESGKMEVYAETFDVEAMLRDVAGTVQSLVEKKNNRLELRLGPSLGMMHSDLTKLRQMLLNLLSNAAKFAQDGTLTLAAVREPGPDGTDWMTLRVIDTGIGMTAEQVGKLFQRFQQADSSTTRKFGGTGLGLSITRAFSAMLGGDIGVQSAPGEGSTFTIRLPASYEASHTPAGDAPEGDGPGGEAAGARASKDLVLVIDDDPSQRELMTRFLAREGFRARTASDGLAGLELARKLKPRAILLDVLMPGVDGWSILSALKTDPDLSGIPVIMVTFVDQRGLAASLGAADYVQKPVKWDRFRQVMDHFRGSEGHILVVDDDEELRRQVRSALQRDGWTVDEAADGQAALEQVDRLVPQVVLLDLTMPTMDGFEFLYRFRARPGCADIPVVVLTARDLTREDRKRLKGASQILNKGETSLRGIAMKLRGLSDAAAAAAS